LRCRPLAVPAMPHRRRGPASCVRSVARSCRGSMEGGLRGRIRERYSGDVPPAAPEVGRRELYPAVDLRARDRSGRRRR
jgi:hypothetical protein